MPFIDRSALRQRLYATADKLAARQRMWLYETMAPYPSAALDVLALKASAPLDAPTGR